MKLSQNKTFYFDRYVYCFDCVDGFTVVHMCKLTESYTLNMCSFVYQLRLNKVKSSLNKCEGA